MIKENSEVETNLKDLTSRLGRICHKKSSTEYFGGSVEDKRSNISYGENKSPGHHQLVIGRLHSKLEQVVYDSPGVFECNQDSPDDFFKT